MKRFALQSLALLLTFGVLAGSVSAWEQSGSEKTITEGERRHSRNRRRGSNWGSAAGAFAGALAGTAISNRQGPPTYYARPAQPTLVCDSSGYCYYISM